MTTTHGSTTSRRRTDGWGWAWAVLAAAILEVVAPVVTVNGPGSSPGEGSGPELLITPVGWAFSIWGVIYALAIAQAIAVLARRDSAAPRRLQADLVVLYLGGALWIVLAGLDRSVTTAAALLVMFAAAIDAVLTVTREVIEPGWLATLTRASVGLYAGWVSAAFFLNLSTALVDVGPAEADQLPWQLVMLVVATLTLATFIGLTRANLAYAAAGIWALIGIAVTGKENGTPEVLIGAIVAAAVLTVMTLVIRTRHTRTAV